MRIAIIGVGNLGGALARAFRAAGHTVVVSSRNPSHAAKIAEELDVAAASSNRVAAENAEMVVLAVPARAVALVVDETAELLTDMGFRPIDTGELHTARVLELMAFLNIRLNARGGWPWQSGWKLLGPAG